MIALHSPTPTVFGSLGYFFRSEKEAKDVLGEIRVKFIVGQCLHVCVCVCVTDDRQQVNANFIREHRKTYRENYVLRILCLTKQY